MHIHQRRNELVASSSCQLSELRCTKNYSDTKNYSLCSNMFLWYNKQLLSHQQISRLLDHNYTAINSSILDPFLQPWYKALILVHKGLELTATNIKSPKNGTILGGYYTIILTRKHP